MVPLGEVKHLTLEALHAGQFRVARDAQGADAGHQRATELLSSVRGGHRPGAVALVVEFTSGLLGAARPDLDPVQLEAFTEAIIGASERLALWRDRRPDITAEQATSHLMKLFAPSLTPGH